MKIAKIGSKEYLFIEVPNDAYDIRYFSKSNKIGFFSNTCFAKNYRKLVDGSYEIITTTNKITEEIARNIVEHRYFKNQPFIAGREYWFKSYIYVKKGFEFKFYTALESFSSLMDSLELDRAKNYLLLEKLF